MEKVGNNSTSDPACSANEPPFAQVILKSFDLTGILLLAMLTLMTLTANLVFVEEVFYIYRKIPHSKRSIFVWINGVAPVIATTSCIGMWIPRSTMFADFTAAAFFAIVNHKFLIMMLTECGGQALFLRRFEHDRFKISTEPCCCFCRCLPDVHINRRTLFLLKLGTFQFAFLCPVLLLLSVMLWTNRNYSLSDLSLSGTAIWINCFIGVLTVIALWPIGIMFQHVRVLLRCKKMTPKFALYQNGCSLLLCAGEAAPLEQRTRWASCSLCTSSFEKRKKLRNKNTGREAKFVLMLNQLQPTIINIVAMQGAIACAPPLSSSARGAYMNQQLLIMEMFLITLISRVIYRKRYDDVELPQDSDQAVKATKPNIKISMGTPAI